MLRERNREKKNTNHTESSIVSFAYTSVIMTLAVEAVKNNYTVQIIWSKVRESYKQGHLWNKNLSWFRIVCVIHCGYIPLAKRATCAWLSKPKCRASHLLSLLHFLDVWAHVCERRRNKTRKTKIPCIYSKVPYNYFDVRAIIIQRKWVGGRKFLGYGNGL